MTENITITAEQIAELLRIARTCEHRYEKAAKEGNRNASKYAAECIIAERMLAAIGIDYDSETLVIGSAL